MTTQVQLRRGTTAEHASFTGAVAELTVDTTLNELVLHDGATAGGIAVARKDYVNTELTKAIATMIAVGF
jgi:uncharacterized protein YihD (DUF1040 family)